ncbi:unnamed protein product [Symbiodinium sp. CCMP2592]|nr:unnamed protein product [Symbiodinium sp. CCMP2592]
MSSVILDSEASFRERCSKIGLSNDLLGKLIEAGYNTFGKLAFAASSTPQGLTDEAVDSWLATVVTPAPGSFQVSVIRRLLFESQSLNVADLKSRVEGTPEGSVRRLPQAERKERIEAQHRRLSGLILTSHTTPAHSCIDLVTDMYENNTLKYIPINRWISRFQEMSLQKKDSAVQMDNEGNLKVIQKKPEPTCDTTGMYPLRQAFQRRSLAFDLGHLCSFEAMETWINKLFEAVQRTVPKGYVAVSLGQVVTADRELFVRLADMLEGQLQKPIGVEKPMDAALRDLSGSQEINQFLQPLVAPPPAPHPTKRPFKELTTPTKGDGKGKTPNKGGEKGGGKASRGPDLVATSDSAPSDAEVLAQAILARGSGITKQDVVQIFDLLPKEIPSRGASSHPPSSFSCGAYAKGGLQGLRSECALFPFCVKLFTTFVRAFMPDHFFTTISLFHNTKTDLHVDSRNHPTPNGVIPVTSFQGGGIWIADGCGPHTRSIKGDIVKGSILSLETPVTFDAFKYPHETESWVGDRLVCVAFTAASLEKISTESARTLLNLGFRPPPDLAFPIPVTAQEQPPVKSDSWVYELFAGSARFSKACKDLGFRVLGLDSSCYRAVSPVAKLDLTLDSAQAIFWDLIKECPPFHVHASPPAGTASRSRERPLPRNHALASKAPKPLRSDDFPLGLPSLSAASQQSLAVRKDNVLYRFVYKLLLHCSASGINVSVENPRNSLFWKVLECFAEAEGLLWPPAALEYVDFDQCCHGSDRPKSTRFLCTRGLFHSLRATCPGNHVHRPWGLVFHERSMQLSSSLVSAYPVLLCKRMASCLESAASFLGLSLQASPDLAASSVAVLGRQHRRFPPLIPEFRKVSWEPPSFQPDDSCRILLSQSAGEDGGRENAAEDSNAADNAAVFEGRVTGDKELNPPAKLPRVANKVSSKVHSFGFPNGSDLPQGSVKVGWYLSMQDHVAKALTLKHPVDTAVALDQDQLDAISFCMKNTEKEVVDHRKLQLMKIKILAKKFEADEARLHSSFDPWFEKVVAGKRLLLWKHLLEQNGFDDMQVCDFMMSGVPIAGQSACPPPFSKKIVPATMSEQDLKSTASFRRRVLTGSSGMQAADLQDLLSKATMDEDQFFIANSLLFGLTASVYGFVRTSRSLHKLLLKIFKLPSSVYFDDFPMFSTSLASSDTDGIISEFLDLLGWSHAKTGSKSHPFAEVFSVLGMQIDLSNMSERSIVLSNKPGRIDRIVEKLESVAASGFLTIHQAQILLGLLNFSSALVQMAIWFPGWRQAFSEMCRHTIKILVSTPPRFISCDSTGEPPILVWTDGAWEPAKAFAGIGAVILDASSGVSRVFQGQVPERLVVRWREEVGEQIICEVELYALLMIRAGLQNFLSGKRIIFFIDNDAARSVVLRGQSRSDAMHRLALALSMVDAVAPCISWIERVPSSSNIADWPSRGEGWKAQKVVRATDVEPYLVDQSLIDAYLL